MADKMKFVVILVTLALIAGLSLPALAQTTGQNTILQNLAANKDFSTLAGAAKTAGMDGVLGGAGPHTVFAPNNAAFGSIPQEQLTALTADNAKLGELLNYHVVPGRVSFADLSGMSQITTADGRTLPVTRNADGTISVAGAKVLGQGIDSSNGIIYPVDRVMMPPGFAMPQAAQAPAQGFPWWLIPLVLLGLGALALYLLTRPRRRPEPQGLKAEPVREEPFRTQEMRRPEETMRDVRESTAAYKEPQITDIVKNMSLPLSGVALTGLNSLISKGTFRDKQDFIGFLAKTFFANNMGAAMESGKAPGESMIMDIIGKTGIAKGFSGEDTRTMLVPLLMTGYTAVYNYLSKRPAVEAR